MNKQRLCKDCGHSVRPDWARGTTASHIHDRDCLECHHDKREQVNLVDGSFYTPDMPLCKSERDDVNGCGPRGRHFVPIERLKSTGVKA